MSQQPPFGQFCWNELITADVEAAKKFYGNLFGWCFSDHDLGEFTYTMIKGKGEEFAGIWAIPQNQQSHIPPHWLSYILVENIESTLKKAVEHGAKVIKPITKTGNLGFLAIISDPTGAHVAFWEAIKK